MPLEVREPQHVWQLEFEGAWPTSVAFAGSSNTVVAGNRDGGLLLWDLPDEPPAPAEGEKPDEPPTVAPARQLVGHANGISRLRYDATRGRLFSASYDRTVRIWDPTAQPTGQGEVVLDLRKRQAEAKRAKNDELLDRPGVTVETLEAEHVLDGHEDWVLGLDVDAKGERLVAGDDGGRTVLYDLASRRELRRWEAHPMNGVVSTALSADGSKAFVAEYRAPRGDFDRPPAQAKIYDTSTGEELLDLLVVQFPDVKERDNSYGYATKWSKFVGRGFVCSAFSPDGRLLAVGQGGEMGDAKVHLVDVETGKVVRTVSNHKYGVCDVRFSADSKHVLTSGRDTTVKIVAVADGKQVAELGTSRGGQFKDWIHAIALSPDEQWVAGADIAGTVHLWRLVG